MPARGSPLGPPPVGPLWTVAGGLSLVRTEEIADPFAHAGKACHAAHPVAAAAMPGGEPKQCRYRLHGRHVEGVEAASLEPDVIAELAGLLGRVGMAVHVGQQTVVERRLTIGGLRRPGRPAATRSPSCACSAVVRRAVRSARRFHDRFVWVWWSPHTCQRRSASEGWPRRVEVGTAAECNWRHRTSGGSR